MSYYMQKGKHWLIQYINATFSDTVLKLHLNSDFKTQAALPVFQNEVAQFLCFIFLALSMKVDNISMKNLTWEQGDEDDTTLLIKTFVYICQCNIS